MKDSKAPPQRLFVHRTAHMKPGEPTSSRSDGDFSGKGWRLDSTEIAGKV
jgi:hypothetical protein